MSQSSQTEDRLAIASPTSAGKYNPSGHLSGASAESSRPSTSSAARTEPHGLYAGYVASARPMGDASTGLRSRRPSADSPTQPLSRPLGVYSMLNPPAESERKEPSVVRPTIPPGRGVPPGLSTGPSEPPRSRKRADPKSPTGEDDLPTPVRTGRRLLTPRSPAIRAASLGPRRNPTFPSTIHPLQPIAGAGERMYTAEPGPYRSSEVPPLPPLGIATGSNLPSLASLEPSAQVPRSPARGLEPLVTHPSDPSPASQASYGQMEQRSPIYRYGLGRAPSQPGTGLRVLSAGVTSGYQAHGPHEGYQTASTSYQMTLDTDQGPMVVPVQLDLQQASKVADEKRKRNAGASARFRARRKEKEKEASQTISGLQQELRALAEERDFYLSERNYYRDLASRHVSPQLLQRPPSPRQRRHAVVTGTGSIATPGGAGNALGREESYRELSDSGSTAQRRRTGDYQPNFLGRQTQSPSTSSSGVGYPMEPALPLPPPPGGPSSYGPPRSMPTGPPAPSSMAHPHPQSYDPFRRDPFDRPWNSGR